MGRGWALTFLCGFFCFFTFSLHFLMVDVSSLTTISTHFRLGSFNFCTCFFTMASKARSGVKRPVLHGRGRVGGSNEEEESEAEKEQEGGRKEGKGKREKTQGKMRSEILVHSIKFLEPGVHCYRACALPSIRRVYRQMEVAKGNEAGAAGPAKWRAVKSKMNGCKPPGIK